MSADNDNASYSSSSKKTSGKKYEFNIYQNSPSHDKKQKVFNNNNNTSALTPTGRIPLGLLSLSKSTIEKVSSVKDIIDDSNLWTSKKDITYSGTDGTTYSYYPSRHFVHGQYTAKNIKYIGRIGYKSVFLVNGFRTSGEKDHSRDELIYIKYSLDEELGVKVEKIGDVSSSMKIIGCSGNLIYYALVGQDKTSLRTFDLRPHRVIYTSRNWGELVHDTNKDIFDGSSDIKVTKYWSFYKKRTHSKDTKVGILYEDSDKDLMYSNIKHETPYTVLEYNDKDKNLKPITFASVHPHGKNRIVVFYSKENAKKKGTYINTMVIMQISKDQIVKEVILMDTNRIFSIQGVGNKTKYLINSEIGPYFMDIIDMVIYTDKLSLSSDIGVNRSIDFGAYLVKGNQLLLIGAYTGYLTRYRKRNVTKEQRAKEAKEDMRRMEKFRKKDSQGAFGIIYVGTSMPTDIYQIRQQYGTSN